MGRASAFVPPDQKEREYILSPESLRMNLVVEAAAGTGKTASMVGRMVALLRHTEGLDLSRIAAVTFTRKAAAQIRDRFRDKLDKAVKDPEVPTAERERLRDAQQRVDEVFTGTIHSFCARLMRERPVEAGVGAGFAEVTEEVDAVLRQRAWDLHIERLRAESSPLLGELGRVGLSPSQLRDAFDTVCQNLDVDQWPAEESPCPDHAALKRLIAEWARHIHAVDAALLPEPGTTDTFADWRDTIRRMIGRGLTETLVGAIEVLGRFAKGPDIKKTKWRGKEGRAAAEDLIAWCEKVSEAAEPHLACWREHRYAVAMRVVLPAREAYDALRRAEGVLNFQDLLLKAARLLREDRSARRYFRERFSHLLVDEFQDTDPIQAEILFFLAARPENDGETDWTRCQLRPGSLFIVGDPKQAIYRFRRADILTYNEVKGHVQAQGGRVIHLRANFRSAPVILEWVNGSFADRFPEAATPQAPSYVALEKGREWDEAAQGGVMALPVPKGLSKKSGFVEHEADLVARVLRRFLDEAGGAASPADFMVITGTKKNLALYSRVMMGLGIPCTLVGGNSFRQAPEVGRLARFLAAALRPEDPSALVGVLRGPLFGVSDDALYRYRRAGGRWYFHSDVPSGLPEEDRKRFEEAFSLFTRCSGWLRALPPLAAIGRIASALGLYASAGSADGGNALAGTLAKALEALRAADAELWSAADLSAYLGGLLEDKAEHDAVPAIPYPGGTVRLMNLHKAKGLEAETVFLADATGAYDHTVLQHIHRAEGRPKGYLLITQKKGWQTDTLAQPKGWESGPDGAPSLEEQEKAFLDAERTRLLYVAGTRGKRRLIVSQKPSDRFSYWKDLDAALAGQPEVAEPGPRTAPARGEAALPRPVAEELAAVEARREASRAPTYAKTTPKDLVVFEPSGDAAVAPAPEGEKDAGGAARGTLIHGLLEAAMKGPGRDLHLLAQSLAAENDLSVDEAQEAVETVRTVTVSPFWERARKASERVVEFPYARMLENRPLPTLETGVIDLAFKENGGWVIVDYKTDRGELPDLLARYRPQLEAYRTLWEQAVGPVKEVLLFSVRAGQTARL